MFTQALFEGHSLNSKIYLVLITFWHLQSTIVPTQPEPLVKRATLLWIKLIHSFQKICFFSLTVDVYPVFYKHNDVPLYREPCSKHYGTDPISSFLGTTLCSQLVLPSNVSQCPATYMETVDWIHVGNLYRPTHFFSQPIRWCNKFNS